MKNEAIEAIKTVKQFTSAGQFQTLREGLRGDESQYFQDKIMEYGERIATMPKSYEQDGKGNQAVAYLHYFTPSADFYITEKDMEAGQHQAFGLANLGSGAELGYISLVEILEAGAELDLHFTPRTLEQIKKAA